MRLFLVLAAVAAVFCAPQARAEVALATPGAFLSQGEAEVAASPDQAWRALTHPERWWNSTHTYSGDARRIGLDARAGGCWCERWNGQSVEHGRVVMVMEREGVRTLRVLGGFGPLQGMGVNGVLTYTVAPHASGAKITMSYRVTGDTGLNLDQLAPLVDGVMMEQFGRLSRYSVSGTPE